MTAMASNVLTEMCDGRIATQRLGEIRVLDMRQDDMEGSQDVLINLHATAPNFSA
jgi:signal transduction histidine kinase